MRASNIADQSGDTMLSHQAAQFATPPPSSSARQHDGPDTANKKRDLETSSHVDESPIKRRKRPTPSAAPVRRSPRNTQRTAQEAQSSPSESTQPSSKKTKKSVTVKLRNFKKKTTAAGGGDVEMPDAASVLPKISNQLNIPMFLGPLSMPTLIKRSASHYAPDHVGSGFLWAMLPSVTAHTITISPAFIRPKPVLRRNSFDEARHMKPLYDLEQVRAALPSVDAQLVVSPALPGSKAAHRRRSSSTPSSSAAPLLAPFAASSLTREAVDGMHEQIKAIFLRRQPKRWGPNTLEHYAWEFPPKPYATYSQEERNADSLAFMRRAIESPAEVTLQMFEQTIAFDLTIDQVQEIPSPLQVKFVDTPVRILRYPPDVLLALPKPIGTHLLLAPGVYPSVSFDFFNHRTDWIGQTKRWEKWPVVRMVVEFLGFDRPHIHALGSFVELVATSRMWERCDKFPILFPAQHRSYALPTSTLKPDKPDEHILYRVENWNPNDYSLEERVAIGHNDHIEHLYHIVLKLVELGRTIRKSKSDAGKPRVTYTRAVFDWAVSPTPPGPVDSREERLRFICRRLLKPFEQQPSAFNAWYKRETKGITHR
jgi:hypothetical protein